MNGQHRRHRHHFVQLAAAAIALAATHLAAAPPQAGPTVTFEKSAVAVTGATPLGRVIFFAETLEDAGYTEITCAHRERIVVADGAGAARFNLGGDVAPSSVWAVIDAASGAYTVAAPPGQMLKALKVPPGLLKRGANGDLTGLDIPFEMASMLVVRPGGGAWRFFNAEGGPGDQPGHGKGRTASRITQFEPLLDKNDPPQKFAQGDLVIAIEPRFLFFFAVKVAGQ